MGIYGRIFSMRMVSDNNILLSLLNTAMRDGDMTLDELCEREDIDVNEIVERMDSIGYSYDENTRSFRRNG